MNHYPQVPWWREPPAAIAESGVKPLSALPASGSMLPFWALMAFTTILLLAPQERLPMLAPLRLALLSAVVAAMAHTISRLARGQAIAEFNSAMIIAGCLTGWAVLMVPLSLWPGGSIGYLMDVYFKTIIVFGLLANVINTMDKLKTISWGLVLLSVPLALTAVRNLLSGEMYGTTDRIEGYTASLTSNPNDMALMLNLILPFTIALFLGSRKATMKLLLGGILCLQVGAIIGTFSRGGFLTLGVIFLAYLWLLRNRPERMWGPIMITVMLFALPLVPPSYYDRINTIVNIEEDTTGSAQTRFGDMKVAARLALENPVIGAGIGQNQLAMNEARGDTWTEIHNVYLQYAVELGFPGLILFLMLYGTCLRNTRDVLRQCRGKPEMRQLFFITEGIRVSLIAFSVAAMFHPVAYHFYFYYMAGLAVAVRTVCTAELRAKGYST